MRKQCLIVVSLLIIIGILINLETIGPRGHKTSLYNRSMPKLYAKVIGTDKKIHRENLAIVDEIMKRYEIEYNLSCGTALGVRREGDIIDRDEDVDIEIDIKYLDKIKEIVDYFKKNEFQLVRYWVDTPLNSKKKVNLISFHRKLHYVDIEFSGEGLNCITVDDNPPRGCDEFLKIKEPYQYGKIGDREYKVPSDKYLEFLYGEDWMVPRKKKPHDTKRD